MEAIEYLTYWPWYVYALIAAVAVGIKVVFQKGELKKEHSLDYVVAMSLVAMIISLFLWPWIKWETVTWDLIGYIYLASVLGSISIWLGAKALRHLDVSVVAPQQVMGTLFTLGLAAIILGDQLTYLQWIGVAVMVGSGLMLTKDSFFATHPFGWPSGIPLGGKDHKQTIIYYELMLLFSIIALSIASIIDKVILGITDPVTFIFIVSIFLFINHLILYWALEGDIRSIPDKVENLGWIIVGIALLTTTARLAYSQSLSLADISLVVPLKKSSILISTIWGGRMFKEGHLLFRVLMAILMLFGVWFLVQ
ncbi:MAG: DMT family transporter [Patescibacteria group bacterium]|nr:DMT family transporter [Patescibacteria group bacterium]